ncbi:LicD family protein [Pseudomonas guariconensis]|uniref:LicD family protein n=1 Tax=Pseudomonas guariconensis TaxID=1288410 RepID=UPI002B061D48|nr:LicD family protein [Pseudomonas guariconensis]
MHDLQGKKLVLFGAGKSGGLFIEQNRDLEILAVADNDPGKQGGTLLGYPIIAAEQITDYPCDTIVVTSVWLDSILKQLDDLGLAGMQIVMPGKREMKGMRDIHPFSDAPTKAIAVELVLTLASLSEAAGIDLYLDFGTLLGAVRDKDFIAWDDDIDFSVNETQFTQLVTLLTENRNGLPHREGIDWDMELLSSRGRDFALRITCRNAPGFNNIIPFETDIAHRVHREGSAVMVGAMPEWFCPQKHFEGFDRVELFGAALKAPKEPYAYLDFVYGEWRVPKKDMTFADYNHSGEVNFESYDNSVRRLS